jgi:hypothetical protein
MASATLEQLFAIGQIIVSGRVNLKTLDRDRLQNEVISNPDCFVQEFERFLQNGGRTQVVVKNFPFWKTINLGTGLMTAEDFRAALKQAGCKIGDWGNDILGQPAFHASLESKGVHLVSVSGRELGFDRNATTQEIWGRARELELELCPNEVGPQLRLQYLDQPMGEWLLVAMEPITGSDGDPFVFLVERDERGLWLDGDCGNPDDVWRPDDRWVFVSRQ